MTDYTDLIKEAEGQLAEQEAEEQGATAELGDSVDLDEGGAFTGRWRGNGTAWTKRGVVDVYLLWDDTGARRFIWPKARLRKEIDELHPVAGNRIAIVRGKDIPNSDPDRSPTQRFAVRVAPSDDPLPEGGTPSDDDIPF